MIIPQWEHICGIINPEMVVNLKVDQGNFEIRSVCVLCGGCGKQHIITGLLDKDDKSEKEQPKVFQKK